MDKNNASRIIRTAIFGITQDEMALILGVSQNAVSKVERQGRTYRSEDHRKAIRKAAKKIGIDFDDAWFDKAPLVRKAVRK